LQVDQLFRKHPHPVNIGGAPTNVDPQIAAIGPTQLLKPLREPGELGLSARIVFVRVDQHADPPHAIGLLRSRHQRPRRRAAEPRDELPPSHGYPSLVDRQPIPVGALIEPANAAFDSEIEPTRCGQPR
jgi:hypothetical protein